MDNIPTTCAARSNCGRSQTMAATGWTHRCLRNVFLSASAFAVLLNSGCHLPEWVHNGFKVGPNYCRPRAPAASEWIDYRDPRVKSEEKPLSEWWRVFNDPALDALIEMAY